MIYAEVQTAADLIAQVADWNRRLALVSQATTLVDAVAALDGVDFALEEQMLQQSRPLLAGFLEQQRAVPLASLAALDVTES